MKEKLFALALVSLSLGFVQALAASKPPRSVGRVERPLSPADYSGENAYWAQFNEEHITATPVEEWLALGGQSPYLIWLGNLNDQSLVLTWDPLESTIAVEQNGELISDLIVFRDRAGRPNWNAAFDEEGNPHLFGFIDIDETDGTIILGICLENDCFRMKGLPELISGQTAGIESTAANCKCFGIGRVTGACSDEDCDNGKKCGTGSKACRWTAVKK